MIHRFRLIVIAFGAHAGSVAALGESPIAVVVTDTAVGVTLVNLLSGIETLDV